VTVDNVLRLVPDMTDLLAKLNRQAVTVNRIGKDLTRSINQLTEQISLSRGEASRVCVLPSGGHQYKHEHVCLHVLNFFSF